MKKWIALGMGLALSAGLASPLWAQAPAAATTAAPQAAGLLGMLGLSKDSLKACKDKICASPIGKMARNMLMPMSAMTGGLIGGCCPNDSALAAAAAAKNDPEGAGGAAGAIMKDEAAAKARALAVRFLGTVDCHYWPEAGEALIKALRGDRNACVRLEAAHALGRGCCCTKETMAALVLTINSSEADKAPSETSERVKAAAAAALAHCLSCYNEVKPGDGSGSGSGTDKKMTSAPAPLKPAAVAQKKTDEMPRSLSNPAVYVFEPEAFADYYRKVKQLPMPKVVEFARQTLTKVNSPVAASTITGGTGGHSVMEIVTRAVGTTRTTGQSIGREPVGDVLTSATQPENGSGDIQPVSYQQPATALPAEGSAVVNHHQMLALLRESVYPETREWAADNLAHFDWRISPEIQESLISSAGKDKAATVRTACIRCMVKMNINTTPVLTALQNLKFDEDLRVRTEADKALVKLSAGRLVSIP